MGTVAYFDRAVSNIANDPTAANQSNLSSYTAVVTLGYREKNDGGGGVYKRYDASPHALSFDAPATGTDRTWWGLLPVNGTINPLQAGANGSGAGNDLLAIQACINYIDWWNTHHTLDNTLPLQGYDSSQSSVKLVIPADHVFRVDTTAGTGLVLKGPITIEGEDRQTSRLKLIDTSGTSGDLFKASSVQRITFRNFAMEGSYQSNTDAAGSTQLVRLATVSDVLFENVTLTRNRGVVIGGDRVRNLTMRDCLISESRRGGLVINDVANVTIENNEFRWVLDDPVALTISTLTDPTDPNANPAILNDGGMIRVVGNRCFGTRGLNINGVKNAIVADNTHTLGRGRAIHIGTSTFQHKGDTSSLNLVVRNNIVTDLLNAQVDPRYVSENEDEEDDDTDRGGCRGIDIELPFAAPGADGANVPGLVGSNRPILDPTAYYYTDEQGAQKARKWKPNTAFQLPDPNGDGTQDPVLAWWDGRFYRSDVGGTSGEAGTPPIHLSGDAFDGGMTWTFHGLQAPTPHSGNIVIEGNIISRSRPPAEEEGHPDHISPFDNFDNYKVGKYGGEIGYSGLGIPLEYITPHEGIALTGSVRNLVVRANHVRNCDVAISLEGDKLTQPLSLLDVTIENNDLFDWKTAGIRIFNYATYASTTPAVASFVPPQRVSILNNRGDGDPFHRSPARGANGRWADTTADVVVGSVTLAAGYGSFIDAKSVSHVLIAGNHARNVSQLVAVLKPELDPIQHALYTMQNNIAFCNPAGVGWQPGNIGVGNLIAPQLGWRYVVESGSQASATYGRVANPCPLAVEQDATGAPLLPATNLWVEGTIVANLKPDAIAGKTYRVWGWRRMTTGTGNAIPANWLPLTTQP